jgi:hydrogenase-4 component B
MLALSLLQIAFSTWLLGAGCSFLTGFLNNKTISITLSGLFSALASLLAGSSAVLVLTSHTGFNLPLLNELHLSVATLTLGVDDLSAFFVLLISVVGFCVSGYSIGYLKAEYANKEGVGVLGALLQLFMLSMVLVVCATNAFSFLVFWECMALFSFFLVSFDTQSQDAQQAGFQYLVMTHAGTACLLMMFLLMGVKSGGLGFNAFSHSVPHLSMVLKSTLFALALVGFGAKAGLIPLHTWLPKAHPAAPSHISALMSGVMLKTAVYGFVRVVFEFLTPFPTWWGTILASIGLITALLGIAYASTETDIKRLLAYSSIENMGTIFFAIGIAMIFHGFHNHAWTSIFLAAALFHSFNHAIFKSLLFMAAGAILSTCHTRSLDKLGGLIHKMPITTVLFLVGVMAVCAFPPLNGFLSEWMIFQGLLLATDHVSTFFKVFFPICAALLGLMGALVVATFVKAFTSAFLAMPRSPHAVHAKEVSPTMLWSMGLASLACLILGVTPAWTFPFLNHLTQQILQTLTIPVAENTITLTSLIGGNQAYAPLLLTGCLVLGGLLAVILPRVLGKKTTVRKELTWSCGVTPSPEFEYTATGFSQPLEVAFSKFHATADMYDTYLYRPLVTGLLTISQKISIIQVGKIQVYIGYILLALIGSLLWIRV